MAAAGATNVVTAGVLVVFRAGSLTAPARHCVQRYAAGEGIYCLFLQTTEETSCTKEHFQGLADVVRCVYEEMSGDAGPSSQSGLQKVPTLVGGNLKRWLSSKFDSQPERAEAFKALPGEERNQYFDLIESYMNNEEILLQCSFYTEEESSSSDLSSNEE